MHTGWKLFEERERLPVSLVHMVPIRISAGKYESRFFEMNHILEPKPGTIGFKHFFNIDSLIDYLPRFKVRAPRLVACKVYVDNTHVKPGSKYWVAGKLLIEEEDWDQRMLGKDLL